MARTPVQAPSSFCWQRLDEDLGDAPGEYLRLYGLTPDRLALASPEAVVLHPGPMNRGVEIADEVADLAGRSLILRQVANGVAMRGEDSSGVRPPGGGP